METPKSERSKSSISSKKSENINPNLNLSPNPKPSPGKSINSPGPKSGSKLKKPGSKNPVGVGVVNGNGSGNGNGNSPMLKNRIRERRFVVAKKSKRSEALKESKAGGLSCKCSKGDGKLIKCLCVAYESLRASQEEFFRSRGGVGVVDGVGDGNGGVGGGGEEGRRELGVSVMKRSRDKGLVEGGDCMPEPGSGKVKNLVEAFEKLKMVTIVKSNESGEDDENVGWGLPGMQDHKGVETGLSSSSFCPSDLLLTSECLGLDSGRSSSLDSNQVRNSTESFGAMARRKWRRRKQLKTTAKPFKLRTEERGKCKEEEFMKKVQQQMEEEERLRVPIAQGLPWTTDEPECLVKPPLKEITRPIDLVLHSDVRAEERAEFDHQVAEKMSFIEQYRMERDRQQKLAEEEEIRRLRKELVPKAQPMPYFDRPFIPRRSEKQPTIPKEPKFHFPQHKKTKCIQQSWSDTSSYISNSDSCYGL